MESTLAKFSHRHGAARRGAGGRLQRRGAGWREGLKNSFKKSSSGPSVLHNPRKHPRNIKSSKPSSKPNNPSIDVFSASPPPPPAPQPLPAPPPSKFVISGRRDLVEEGGGGKVGGVDFALEIFMLKREQSPPFSSSSSSYCSPLGNAKTRKRREKN